MYSICSLNLVTPSQIEKMWARFKNLDKNDKGYLERGDMLRIPELAINPLGDRIVHAFFTDTINKDATSGTSDDHKLGFPEFVRVMAHFQPTNKDATKNRMNSKHEKLKCKYPNYFFKYQSFKIGF